MKFSVKRDDNSLDKLIAAAQLQPLLSNAKWVKLIRVLIENWQLGRECRVKLIWESVDAELWLYINEHDSYNFNY